MYLVFVPFSLSFLRLGEETDHAILSPFAPNISGLIDDSIFLYDQSFVYHVGFHNLSPALAISLYLFPVSGWGFYLRSVPQRLSIALKTSTINQLRVRPVPDQEHFIIWGGPRRR